MTFVWGRTLAVTVALGLVVGCGSKDEGSSLQPLSQQNQALAASSLEGSLESSLALFAPEVDPSGMSLLDSVPTGLLSIPESSIPRNLPRSVVDPCITETGSMTDADSDGVPDSYGLSFNCTITDPQTGDSMRLTGAYSIQDDDNAGPTFNYSLAWTDLAVSLTSTDGTLSVRQDGTAAASTSGASYQMDQNFTASIESTSSGQSASISLSNDWRTTYTPDTTWAFGTPLADGDVTVSGTDGGAGRWSIRVGAEGASASVLTDPSVHYSASCLGADAGAMEATWEDPNGAVEMRIEYSGCNAGTVTVNGQPVS